MTARAIRSISSRMGGSYHAGRRHVRQALVVRSPRMAAPALTRSRIALGLYVLVTAACFLTVARDRLHSHTPANHFALLADAWLHGRLDLGGPPPPYTGNNDFAFF